MRVLIADDSVVSRHLLEASVRKWGYEAVVACDGDEAWRILQGENPPALAVLDWMMPGMTGLDLCRLIRQQDHEPYTYILLLTSKGLKEDLLTGMDAGADDYVIKPFDSNELQVRLRAGSRIVSLQSQLLAAREALREQATHDALTKLWNRSYILEQFARDLARAEREHGSVGVVLVDIDHFKSINDTHGHITGDAVLREAARRMQASIRPYDSLGRYGGEEFLLLLPGCNDECTVMHAERMRHVLRSEPMLLNEQSITLTASFGTTTAHGGSRCTPEALIRIADETLYEAKRRGRDCVVHTPSRRQVNALLLEEMPVMASAGLPENG